MIEDSIKLIFFIDCFLYFSNKSIAMLIIIFSTKNNCNRLIIIANFKLNFNCKILHWAYVWTVSSSTYFRNIFNERNEWQKKVSLNSLLWWRRTTSYGDGQHWRLYGVDLISINWKKNYLLPVFFFSNLHFVGNSKEQIWR